MIEVGSLIAGKEYKVKYEGEKRAATRTYVKDYTDAPAPCAEFNGTGGTKFYLYSEIISAIEVDPTKKKARKPRKCDRCNGHGYMEHVSHVEGGKCFKCCGIGKI